MLLSIHEAPVGDRLYQIFVIALAMPPFL